MKYWNTYQKMVNANCTQPTYDSRNLTYLQDHLFAGMICYLLPFSLIALIPGLYMSYATRKFALGIDDLLVMTGISIVAFIPGIKLNYRKAIFVSCLYLLSCSLLYFLGLYGPALVYLLASCIFSILIFPTTKRFRTAWVNGLVCVVFIIFEALSWMPRYGQAGFGVGTLVAVISNLIFLSFLSAALIPRLFNGLQETIDYEKDVKKVLHEQQKSLNLALDMLQQKNIELEQFAYVASHDLKEPVRMVMSFMGLLQNRYEGQLDEKAHTYINMAMDGGKRMQKMIDDLLEFSRITHQDPVKEHVSLDQLLSEVKSNITKQIEENKVVILVKKELPVLWVYRSDIIRLLQNLLSNAIKFKRKGTDPIIQVDAEETEKLWKISIADNGIGIEKDMADKVFEIFSRLHPRESYEGTGIGLAICKKVIEHHQGKIWVESNEGHGSTFYFEILK